MSNILTIAYLGEGTTDERFLGNIIKRTFVGLAPNCKGMIEVYDPQFIEIQKQGFVDQSLEAAKHARWSNILCIHTDADSPTDEKAIDQKITPAIEKILKSRENLCRNIVPIVPVYMTEAWMLADVDLLIEEIGTTKSREELELPVRIKQVESINNPKF